jgi:hypothetical protein
VSTSAARLALIVTTLAAMRARAEPEAPAPSLPLRLGVQTEGAAGTAPGQFYNQLLGARLDVQFPPQVSIGAYVGYINLKGKGGRANNLLSYAQVEYMFGSLGNSVRFPVRFGTGYLPMNGPMARLSGGLAFWLSPRMDLITEVAPTFWMTGDQMLLSIDLALEIAYRF